LRSFQNLGSVPANSDAQLRDTKNVPPVLVTSGSLAALGNVSTPQRQISLPPTGLELVERRLDELRDALHRVFEVSEIYYDDPNAGDSGVVFIGWNVWHWKPLPADAAPKVGAARDALRAFMSLPSARPRPLPMHASRSRNCRSRSPA